MEPKEPCRLQTLEVLRNPQPHARDVWRTALLISLAGLLFCLVPVHYYFLINFVDISQNANKNVA